MWICHPSCRAWSLHWQHYDRIQLVRGFGSIILPIAGGGLINAGSPKEGRFCKTKHLVVVDGDGSLWHNMRLPSCQTRPSMRRIWSEMFLKRTTQFESYDNISKSNHDDANRENNRKIQREIRHNSEKRILCFFLPCDKPSIRSVALGVRRQCENCNSTARRNAECTSETKPQGITFIIRRTKACNLEIHCAIAPGCIASLI